MHAKAGHLDTTVAGGRPYRLLIDRTRGYNNGQHRAQAVLDVGVRRTLGIGVRAMTATQGDPSPTNPRRSAMATADSSSAHVTCGVPDRASAGSAAAVEASEHALGPQAAAILATEHWSLLATRSLTWTESFSRAQMFLSVLSGAVVALALVAQATSFGAGFVAFALVTLPVVLFVGLTTFIRLVAANNDEARWVLGIAAAGATA
jgi:hypothetical protein